MAIYAQTFKRTYKLRPKNTGASERCEGETLVTDLSAEDLPKLDPEAIAAYASAANQRWARRLVSGRGGYWGEVDSNADLSKLLEQGWQDGAKLVAELAEEVLNAVPRPAGARRKVRWQDTGDELDMMRAYRGGLDTAWRATPRQRDRAPRVISLTVDVGQNCHVGAEQLQWAGIAAAALTDALEDSGYRVELHAACAAKSNVPGNGVALTRILAKRAGEPLNREVLAALVALPATFRWYGIMSWLAHPQDIGAGYGQSVHLAEVLEAAATEQAIDATEILLGGCLSREEAVALVTETLQRMEAEEALAYGTMR